MSSVKKKRGLFASRAHSFKENFLDAIKHSPVPTAQRKSRPEKNAIVLAKKTSSSDNLTVTGHLGTSKTTDCLIKDVQFALKYFQDVVSKQTYEMLPGCATVVLETVLAIKAFATNIGDNSMDSELCSALQNSFKAVAVLTAWADSVIVKGGQIAEESHETDYVDTVIEPVRRAVIVAVNCISVRIGAKSLARGNSLPDITSDNGTDYDQDDVGLSLSSDSLQTLCRPPLLPKQSEMRDQDEAPPLPPKNLKPRLERFEDLMANSLSLHSIDWSVDNNGVKAFPTLELNKPRQSLIRRTQFIKSRHHDNSLPSPSGLNTTFADHSLEHSFDNSSPRSISKESLSNLSHDETDGSQVKNNTQFLSSKSWSSRERSANSSPSLEGFSMYSHHTDPHDGVRDPPPAIPKKSRYISAKNPSLGVSTVRGSSTRKLSQYDNVADAESFDLRQVYELRRVEKSLDQHIPVPRLQLSKSDSFTPNETSSPILNKMNLKERAASLSRTSQSRNSHQSDVEDIPPPLPPKKRNIMSYMEIFGKSILPSGEDLFQGFVQSHDLLHNVWQHNFHEYSEYTPSGLLNFPFITTDEGGMGRPYMNLAPGGHGLAPALPPKLSSGSRPGSFRSSGSLETERRIPILIEMDNASRHSHLSDSGSSSSSEMPRMAEITKLPKMSVQIPIQRISSHKQNNPKFEQTLLDEVDVSGHLVYGEQSSVNNNNNNSGKKSVSASGTVELRAGTVDALIVLATQTIKNDFLYQEAFLATYRTFVSTEILVDKLVYRFTKFANLSLEEDKQGPSLRISRNAFSLLVRAVDGLADVDFSNQPLLEKLTNFITSLVESGDLGLARALRSQFIHKYEERRARLLPDFDMTSLNSVNRKTSLLNFKSLDIAEQMTLLDSQLYLPIDSAELLIWVQEQSEEKSVNLTKFTEHFNNMSYWTRTLILQQPDAKERERFLTKFIKIMKWLRKMNNFNSYLAILSALDSAPIRRLEWQKSVTEGLKEYCSLIDSSSSFRAYRLALAQSSPPCIPYIGLILQDLTFVQIGNPDKLDGKINFAKRWQQFNILDNLRRFKKEQYHINRQEEIILFFGDFQQFLSEDEMWSLSESIKPRGQTNKSLK